MTTIFMILPSKGMQGVSGCVVFDAAKDAGSAAGKPCGGLEARLNFAWVSVQDSGTKEQDDPRKRPAVPAVSACFTGATTRASFGDDHRAINGLRAMAMSGDGRR
jgi:hypothetical protein